jgi:hypothetical protein
MSRAAPRCVLALLLVAGLTALSPRTAAGQGFQASAPEEPASDATRTRRTFVVGDMQRIGLVSTVEQGPRGVLRVGIGQNFHSSAARDLYFGKLASAYFEWRGDAGPLVIELWDGSGKVGEYYEGSFYMGQGYSTPVGCADGADAESCGPKIPPGPPAPQVAVQGDVPPPDVGPGHAGLHFSVGMGGGSASLSCDGCDYSRETSVSGYLAIAKSVHRNVLLGVEGTGWTQSEGAQIYSLMAQATGYLNATSGLFVSCGFGLVGRREDSRVGDLTASGLGFSTRLGYEVGMGPSFLLIPYVAYVSTIGGADFKFNGTKVGDYDINNIQFGLGIGIH